ncbi:hypothetical protein FisN_7Lh199 [Fistulifera solaris]|uniref:Kinesin motor domain-containing protein n=1 Tax=Fistulifera solaris TaxID=1519565 RepID=A0A1Z5JDH4_FISSO|nr:hypothetical protein FisN_7Lh199 [Fistulifera solaris]|eukprot:GAX11811.1 hypothetical protein FisN_7Lh199 [Fistulifera solaris]
MVSQIAPLAQEDWTRTFRFQHVVWPPKHTHQKEYSVIHRDFPDNTLMNLCSGAANDILAKDSTINRIFVALGNSGKTEILFGSIATQKPSVAEVFAQSVQDLSREELLRRYGLLGWTVQSILDRLPEDKTAVCTLSVLEVSDENSLFDLLATRPFTQDASKRVTIRYNNGSNHAWSKDEVQARGTGTVGAVVEGLSNQPIDSLKGLAHSMRRAFAAALHEKRKTSRGTLVISVRVWQQAEKSQFQQKFEKNTAIQFVDLGVVEHDEMPAYFKRNAAIRKSESVLGSVLRGALLREAGHDAVIPYRDSALTKVLQRSMDHPDSRTIVMACLSPGIEAHDESMLTLRYISRLTSKPGQEVQSTSFDSIMQASTTGGSPSSSAPLNLSELTKEDGSSAYLLQNLLSDPRQRLAKLAIPGKVSKDVARFSFEVSDDEPTPYKGPSSPKINQAVQETRVTSEDPKSISEEQRAPPGKHISSLTSQKSDLSSTETPSKITTPLAQNMNKADSGASPPSFQSLRPSPPGCHLKERPGGVFSKTQLSMGASGDSEEPITPHTVELTTLHQVNVSPILPRTSKDVNLSGAGPLEPTSIGNSDLSSISRNMSEDLKRLTKDTKKEQSQTPNSAKTHFQAKLSPKFDSSVVQKSKKAMNFLRKTWSEDDTRASPSLKFINRNRDNSRDRLVIKAETSVDQAMNDLSFELLRRSKALDNQKILSNSFKSELDDLSMELFGKQTVMESDKEPFDEVSDLSGRRVKHAMDLSTPRHLAPSLSESLNSKSLQASISNSASLKRTASAVEGSVASDLDSLQSAMEHVRLSQNSLRHANNSARNSENNRYKSELSSSRRIAIQRGLSNGDADSVDHHHNQETEDREKEIKHLRDQLERALAEKSEVVKIAEEAIMTQAELEERVLELERQNSRQTNITSSLQSETNFIRNHQQENESKDYQNEVSGIDAKLVTLQHRLMHSERERKRLEIEVIDRQREYVQLISKFDGSLDREDVPISVQEDDLRRLLISKDSTIVGLTEDKEKLTREMSKLMDERSALIDQLEELEKELSFVKTERDDMATRMNVALESQDSLIQELEETRFELDRRLTDVQELSSSIKKLLREKEESDALNERMEEALSSFESETRFRLDKVLDDRREAKSLLENTLRDNAKLVETIKSLRESLESARQESEEERLRYHEEGTAMENLERENLLLREQNREMRSALEQNDGRSRSFDVPNSASSHDIRSTSGRDGGSQLRHVGSRTKFDPSRILSPASTSSIRAEDVAAFMSLTAKASLDEKILLASIGDAKDAEIEALRLRIRLLERRKAEYQ